MPIVGRRRCALCSASDSAVVCDSRRKIALHHDDGGVDDQPEIDRADRQQIGGSRRAAPGCSTREEQRERYGRADDQRAAEVAQEYPLQQDDQSDADHHVVQHGVGGDVDQVLAVVDALDRDARRQDRGMFDC